MDHTRRGGNTSWMDHLLKRKPWRHEENLQPVNILKEFTFPFKILQQHVDYMNMPQILIRAHNLVYLLYMMIVPCTSLLECIADLESGIGKALAVHKEPYPTEGIKHERAAK